MKMWKFIRYISFIAITLSIINCGGEDRNIKVDNSNITSEDVCKLINPNDLESIVGKELLASPDNKNKFNNARVCSYTNKSGYPYFVLTLYFNEKGEELSYFAPPNNVFNSYIKVLNGTETETIAVISKESENTIELLAKSDKRVVAISLFNVEANDESNNQKILIKKIQDMANQAKNLK